MPRHHLVPQMLLRRFAKNGVLSMVPRDRPRDVLTSSVRNACAQVGFYRVDVESVDSSARQEHDPEIVEGFLSHVESEATPLVNSLCGGDLLRSDEDRYRLARLAALQMCRGEAFRQDMDAWLDVVARDFAANSRSDLEIAAQLREWGRADDQQAVEAFREEVRISPWRIVTPQAVHVQEAVKHAVEVVMPRLYFRPWTLLRSEDPLLLTSDNPVVCWSPASPTDSLAALFTAQEIFFPLDRYTCLSFGQGFRPDVMVPLNPEKAAVINGAVAAEARRWIFHHPDDDPLRGVDLPGPTRIVREVLETKTTEDGHVVQRGIYVRRASSTQNRPESQ